MIAVILAGGFGTRLAEETSTRPKPMVEIGGRPILWHIMQHYSRHGITEFVICLGYKSEYIKKFFLDYAATMSDFSINLASGETNVLSRQAENWSVTLIDTGYDTMTGGRIKRAISYVSDNQPFCLTYGDGLSNVDISSSIKFHSEHGKLATVTAVSPPGRFGVLDIGKTNEVVGFREKIVSDQYKINGGFFILNPGVKEYIDNDQVVWEDGPMQQLARERELVAWHHDDFWHPMDTLRDKTYLESKWKNGDAPWAQ